MSSTSVYDFRNISGPIPGSNGNPFGNCVFGSNYTFLPEGIRLDGLYSFIKVTSTTPLIIANGFSFEIKFKATNRPSSVDKYICTLQNRNGTLPFCLRRSPTAATDSYEVDGLKIEGNIFIYDSTFHTYRIDYDPNAQTTILRDGGVLRQSPSRAFSYDGTSMFLVGNEAGVASDPGSEFIIEYISITGESTGFPSVVLQSDQTIAKGIARGFERGIV